MGFSSYLIMYERCCIPTIPTHQLRRGREVMAISIVRHKVEDRFLGIRLLVWEYIKPCLPRITKSITFQPWETLGCFTGHGLDMDSLAVWQGNNKQLVSRKLPSEDILMATVSTDLSITHVLHHKGIIYYKVKEDSLIRRWSCALNTDLSPISAETNGSLLASGDYIFNITNRECQFINTGIDMDSFEWQAWFEVKPLHDDPFSPILAMLTNRATRPPKDRVEAPYSSDIIVSADSWQCVFVFYSNRSIVYLRINATSYSFPSHEPILDCCLIPYHAGLIAATTCRYGLGVVIIDVIGRCTLQESVLFPGFCSNWIHVLSCGRIVFEFEDDEDYTQLGSIPLG